MEKLLSAFLDTIVQLNETLNKLAEMGQNKQQLIISGQVQELDKLIQKEGIIVSHLEKLEGARFKLQTEIAGYWGLAPEQLPAAAILERLKAHHHQSYDALKAEMENLKYNLDNLRSVNSHNNDLIDQSLDYIDEMQSLLYGDIGTYSERGIQSADKPLRPYTSIIDEKA